MPSLLLEHVLGDVQSCDCTWPARVECKVRDGLDQLLLREAIVTRANEMRTQLVRTIQSDQGADGDQAAVALGELRALPHIPEQHVVGEVCHFRRKAAEPLLDRRLRRVSRGQRLGLWGRGRRLRSSGWYAFGHHHRSSCEENCNELFHYISP